MSYLLLLFAASLCHECNAAMDQSLLRFYLPKGLQIGEIVEIQKNGAVASLKDNGELIFIPGWKHT